MWSFKCVGNDIHTKYIHMHTCTNIANFSTWYNPPKVKINKNCSVATTQHIIFVNEWTRIALKRQIIGRETN